MRVPSKCPDFGSHYLPQLPAITIKITNLAAVVRKRADFSQDRTKGGLGFCILARSMLVGAWLCEFFLQNEPTRQSTKSADLGSLLGRPGLKSARITECANCAPLME